VEALGLPDLIVQPAQHAAARARVIVLDAADIAANGAGKAAVLKLSRKKPRSSPNTFGSKSRRHPG
jgi:hypothetical protein